MPSGHDQPREGRAEFAARGELVVGPAAEGFLGLVAAHEPEHLRARGFLLEVHEVDQRADGRVAAAQHRDCLACIAASLPPQDVRHRVGNMLAEERFADGFKTVRAGGIGG